MSDLFTASADEQRSALAPLADRMRPATLDEVVGQSKLLDPQGPLRQQIEAGFLPNMLLVGPPGTGKTTIARLVARSIDAELHELSAVACGLADVRAVVAEARRLLGGNGRQTVLFLDEIHRFNKAQQDALLPSVEDGTIRLVGATTENPYVTVNRALLSRVVVHELTPLGDDELRALLQRATEDSERGLSRVEPRTVTGEALDELLLRAGGDARRALTLLEAAAHVTGGDPEIGAEAVGRATDARAIHFDRAGDAHYDTISAYIKSMRAGDADGAVKYLASMLVGGEDPMFIARRLAIFASEDNGHGDRSSILMAAAAMQVVEKVGMPECRITLAHVTRHCALAAKDRTAYEAMNAAMDEVRRTGTPEVPPHLRNRP